MPLNFYRKASYFRSSSAEAESRRSQVYIHVHTLAHKPYYKTTVSMYVYYNTLVGCTDISYETKKTVTMFFDQQPSLINYVKVKNFL